MIPDSVFHCLKWFLSFLELRALKFKFCVGHTQFLKLFKRKAWEGEYIS